jgi:hypothetical protein
MSKLWKTFNSHYTKINSSKLLSGLAMIILNIFSKYVQLNFSKTQEAYIRNAITREILIFTIFFVGTNDLITAFLLTAAFMILSSTVFNHKSRFCVIPEKYKKLDMVLDTNKDNHVSDIEIEKARDILRKANLQSSNQS